MTLDRIGFNMFDKSFTLNFPLDRTHCGMPLANGNMGVLVWGEGCRLCVTVNRGDHWDHRFGECLLPGQSYQQMVDTFDPNDISPTNDLYVRDTNNMDADDLWWRSTRLPVGRFEFLLNSPLDHASLNYDSGMLEVQTTSGQSLQLIISRDCHQLLIQDANQIVTQVIARPAWQWVGSLLSRVGYEPPVEYQHEQLTGWFQSCPEDLGITCLCSSSPDGWRIGLTREANMTWQIELADWESTFADNKQWWQRYWSTCPRIDLPHETWLGEFYQFALYKFACATDPKGVACGLQGPWVEEYQKTPWSGDYHFNINIQQIYTLALSTGAYEHMFPLFDMLESDTFQKTLQENAYNLLGINDGLLLTHAVDDHGMQCGGIQVGSTLDFSCGGWVAQLYWLYYQHTQDFEFLRNRAWPFMRGVMRVFETVIQEYQGRLSIPLSISAEYGFTFPVLIDGKPRLQNAGRDASNQLMCAHMLVDALLEASTILKIEPDPKWLDIKNRLPKYVTDDTSAHEHILLWEGQDLDVCHRHHSHLANVYPFMNYNPNDDAEAQIVNNTIDHWILQGMGQWSEWCYPWAAIIQARVGFSESPVQLLKIWRELYINEGMATVYLPRFHGLTVHRRADMDKPRNKTEIMQLDGTMAGATAILEMLVHQQAGVIHLFRGIPQRWSDAAFEKVRLPDGLTVSASMNDGKLEQVIITGPTRRIIPVMFRGQTQNYLCQPATDTPSSRTVCEVTASSLTPNQ